MTAPDAPVSLLVGASARRLEEAALALAARILCRHACPEGSPAPDCADCRRVLKKQHPDLLIAAPEQRRRVNVPGFEESSSSKETTIPTALVRAIAGEATRHPYEGRRRVLVLLDVDRTEAAALNALLKVLEEPPTAARFVLTATRPRRLPATILSRVVLRPIPVTTRAETAADLCRRGLSAEEAEARAAFADSDTEEAAALDLTSLRAHRDALLEAASGVFLTSSPAWAVALAAELAGEDAADTGDNLTLLAQLLRDAVAASVDPAGRGVVHRERYRDLARLGSVSAARLLDAATGALDLASDLSESNRNPRLAAEAFALGLLERTFQDA